MSPPSHTTYYQTETMTAAPERLQLMLIEGALRLARKAQEQWEVADRGVATTALLQAQQIVTEMIASLRPGDEPELIAQVANVYLFVLRSLAEANTLRNAGCLTDAIRILDIERDTWREVCQQMSSKVPAPHISLTPGALHEQRLSLEG